MGLFATGCKGDDDSAAVDASVSASDAAENAPDAAATPDAAAPGVDATASVDASGAVPDAGGGVDAAPGTDAGSGDVSTVCAALCEHIATCFDFGGPSECMDGCVADLSDCSAMELDELKGCSTVDCDDLESCVTAADCVDDGDDDPECGDGACNGGESCGTCPGDCGACECGDGTCDLGECASCAADCPDGCSCPHDECQVGMPLDPGCGDCVADICAADSFCCTVSWDITCANAAVSVCDKACPGTCGDDICTAGENKTCASDCFDIPEPPPMP